MNRNGRKVALGLTVIVLGAGVLLKVIPPETGVDVNNRHLINIDGSLVSNPLDLSETTAGILPVIGSFPATEARNAPNRQNDGSDFWSPRSEPGPIHPLPSISAGSPARCTDRRAPRGQWAQIS